MPSPLSITYFRAASGTFGLPRIASEVGLSFRFAVSLPSLRIEQFSSVSFAAS